MRHYRGSKIVPVRFPASELERLDRLGAAYGLNRSETIRIALDKLETWAYHTRSATPPNTHKGATPGGGDSGPPPPPIPRRVPSSLDEDEIDDLIDELTR